MKLEQPHRPVRRTDPGEEEALLGVIGRWLDHEVAPQVAHLEGRRLGGTRSVAGRRGPAAREAWWLPHPDCGPEALPFVVAGLRLTFAPTLIGVVIAELFSATSGIGHELMREVLLARTDRILALVTVIVAIALVPFSLLRLLERRVTERYALDRPAAG